MQKALTDWVEKGVGPPGTVILSGNGRRLMCRYPEYPKYKGKGSPRLAESFVCAAR